MFGNFSVVLVEPRYEGNVGSVARVMKNFGFDNLVLVNPPVLDKEARAMSMHGRDILEKAVVLEDFSEVVDRFSFLVGSSAQVASDGNTLRTPVTPDGLGNALDSESDIALVFGREDYGLLNEELQQCDSIVYIPANTEYPTLNLAQSVGIILYELSRQPHEKDLRRSRKKFNKLNVDEKRVLLEKYDKLVDLIYDRDFENRLTKKTFRQLLGRSFLSGREASTLIGLFRRAGEQIEDKD